MWLWCKAEIEWPSDFAVLSLFPGCLEESSSTISPLRTELSWFWVWITATTRVPVRACPCSVTSDSLRPYGLQPTRLLCPWNVPGKHIGVGCHVLLQGIFLTQRLNLHLLSILHRQADSLPLHHLEISLQAPCGGLWIMFSPIADQLLSTASFQCPLWLWNVSWLIWAVI